MSAIAQDRVWRCVGLVFMALVLRFIVLPVAVYSVAPHPGCTECDVTLIP